MHTVYVMTTSFFGFYIYYAFLFTLVVWVSHPPSAQAGLVGPGGGLSTCILDTGCTAYGTSVTCMTCADGTCGTDCPVFGNKLNNYVCKRACTAGELR